MVFIMNREGTIVETVTSPVHQGSNANEILLLAPFAPTNTVTVGFKLPNGILIQPRLTESGTGETMTNLEVNDLFLKVGADEESMSAWYIKINRDLTRYSGELGIQFFIYDGAGDILASSYATVTVQKGVPILDGTTFDASTATQLQAALDKITTALTAVKTDVGTLQTDVGTLKTDMSGAKDEITTLKDRMELAETNISTNAGDITRLTDSVDKNTTDIADLKESKLDKTGGTISGDLEVAGNLYVNGNIFESTFSALKDRVDLLYTIIENTIITLTDVEDTYTSRVTAGGLPVVSNAPTTVHKITGASAATINLAKLMDGTFTSNGVTFVSSSETGAVHISGSLNEGATYASLTVSYFSLRQGTYTLYTPHKIDKVGWIIRNANDEKVDEISWSGTDTVKSFTVSADGNYSLYIFIHLSLSTTLNYTETPMLLYGDRTASLPAFTPYYTDLRSASFKSVTSTGKNLLKPSEDVTYVAAGVTFRTTRDAGTVEIFGTPTSEIGKFVMTDIHLPNGKMTLYFPNKAYGVRWFIKDKTGVTITFTGNNSSDKYIKFTASDAEVYSLFLVVYPALVSTIDYVETPMILYGSVTENFPPFELYKEDTSFQLSAARQLRKWDYIDVDNQLLVIGSDEITQETAFTDEELANYPTGYILSDDRKTIVYPLETPTTAPLTVPQTYTAWRNGSETVDTGATDALPPTITQTYYEEVNA